MLVPCTVTQDIEINSDAVRHLLTNAFEGGSDYWMTNLKQGRPSTLEDREQFHGLVSEWHWRVLLPTTGGSVTFDDVEPETAEHPTYTLDENAISRGLTMLARKYPTHFADHFYRDNSDADTGDVFLQCCIFGDITYA